MSDLIIPESYVSALDVATTEKAIKKLKDYFEVALADELELRRVTAPIVVLSGTGINDDLNGIERPVSFPIKDINEQNAEVVQSLAKWKRLKLADLNLPIGQGIYTDMNAIRPDEVLGSLHSIYVDQWDWEKTIHKSQRDLAYLKKTVTKIYNVLKRAEENMSKEYPPLKKTLPEDIYFIHSEELLKLYPTLTPKQREYEITKKHRAVFVIGIGAKLSNNQNHDGRAPDYDDWISENEDGYKGLNGDILIWNNILDVALEISSMGIRVDKRALIKQLKETNQEHKSELMFHKMLLNDRLPYCIGGGIGQSRVCMLLLQKAHIGEVQSSIWSDEIKEKCKKSGINLL